MASTPRICTSRRSRSGRVSGSRRAIVSAQSARPAHARRRNRTSTSACAKRAFGTPTSTRSRCCRLSQRRRRARRHARRLHRHRLAPSRRHPRQGSHPRPRPAVRPGQQHRHGRRPPRGERRAACHGRRPRRDSHPDPCPLRDQPQRPSSSPRLAPTPGPAPRLGPLDTTRSATAPSPLDAPRAASASGRPTPPVLGSSAPVERREATSGPDIGWALACVGLLLAAAILALTGDGPRRPRRPRHPRAPGAERLAPRRRAAAPIRPAVTPARRQFSAIYAGK